MKTWFFLRFIIKNDKKSDSNHTSICKIIKKNKEMPWKRIVETDMVKAQRKNSWPTEVFQMYGLKKLYREGKLFLL